MKRPLALAMVCAFLIVSCVRYTVTTDGRLIPNDAFGLGLSTPAQTTIGTALPGTTWLYTGSIPKDALGTDGISILYAESLGLGRGTRHHFDAFGILRFFPDGNIIWKFVRQGQPGGTVVLQDGFGDDFTGGYVGKYTVEGAQLSMEFYVATLGGLCFALFNGTIAPDGSITLSSYKTRMHGVFELNNHTKVIQPLVFTKQVVGPMTRSADW